jgi:hypothetical protein
MRVTPDEIESAWVSAVALWNTVGLPVVLAVPTASTLVKGARGASWWAERRRVIRNVGLMHFGLALWAVLGVLDEAWAAREQGVSHANPIVVMTAVIATAIDLPVGLGLRRFWRGARWGSIVFNLLRWTLAVWLTMVVGGFGATFDPTEWPRLAVGRVVPAFVLVALLLPRTGRAFRPEPGPPAETPANRTDLVLTLAARLFLVVLASVVVVDALDLALRVTIEAA